MAAFDFRDQLFGPWETAKGFLVEQFDRLYAALTPLQALISSAPTASAVVSTDTKGALQTSAVLPAGLSITAARLLRPSSGASVVPVAANLSSVYAVTTAQAATFLGHCFGASSTVAQSPYGCQALEGYALLTHQSGTTSLAIATIGNSEHAAAGTTTDLRGVQGGVLITDTGGGTDAAAVYAAPSGRQAGGTGTFTNGYGFRCAAFGAGFTNTYVLHCPDATAGIFLGSDVAVKASTNTWQVTSDRRLKRNIQPFTDGLAVVEQLTPITYERNGLGGHVEGQTGIGLIAQDAQPAVPYCIGETTLQDDETYLTLDSGPLTFVLLNAVRELAARVRVLEGRS